MSRDIQNPTDATANTKPHSEQAQALSDYANGLVPHTDSAAPVTDSSLPPLRIVDAHSSKSQTIEESYLKFSDEKPGILSRIAHGAVGTVEALATGAYKRGENTYHSAVNAGGAVINGVEKAYENRGQIPGALEHNLLGAADAVISVAHHPGEVLTPVKNFMGKALASTGKRLEADGVIAADSAVSAGKWVANHKLETTALAGIAAIEMLTYGTATPVIAGLGALAALWTSTNPSSPRKLGQATLESHLDPVPFSKEQLIWP